MASNAHRLLTNKIAPIIRKRKASASSTFIELQSKTGSAQFRANAKRIAIVREIIFFIFFMLFCTMLSARWYGSERSYQYASSLRNALVETPKMAFSDITSNGQAISWLTIQFPAGLAAEPFRNEQWQIVGPVRMTQLLCIGPTIFLATGGAQARAAGGAQRQHGRARWHMLRRPPH
jgi:hypothetical protein